MEPTKKITRLIGKTVKIWESDRIEENSVPLEGDIFDIWNNEWIVLTTKTSNLYYVQKSKIFYIEVKEK